MRIARAFLIIQLSTGFKKDVSVLLKKSVDELEKKLQSIMRENELLRKTEDQYRSLFENANDLIQSVDKNGKFVYVNRKWLKTLGYTNNEAKELSFTDIIRKDQVPHCLTLFKKICSGQAIEYVETVFISKKGREIPVEGNINSKFKDGEFIATQGIFRDITKRKQIEEEVIESEEKLRLIFDSANDMIIYVDRFGARALRCWM